jgi:hypothetical protein
MNAGASVVTLNVRDFRMAEETLGLRVFTPLEAIRLLLSSEEE